MIAKTRIDYDASSPAELPMPGRLSYTIDEAASATGLTRRKIQGACARGELVWSKIGNTIVIPASSLRRLVKEIS